VSDFEGRVAYKFPGGELCVGLGEVSYGGFSPNTEDGADMLRQIGKSGFFGQWLAEGIALRAYGQAQRARFAQDAAASVQTSYQPQAPGMGFDQHWLVAHAVVERSAAVTGDEVLAARARARLGMVGRSIIEAGRAAPNKVRDMIKAARGESRALLN
jgi:hypothetical protein